MVKIPSSKERADGSTRVITDGIFEREYTVDTAAAASFLRAVADQLEAGTSITISGEDWELPFEFEEPVELEIEFEGNDKRELEVEVELTGTEETDDVPSVA